MNNTESLDFERGSYSVRKDTHPAQCGGELMLELAFIRMLRRSRHSVLPSSLHSFSSFLVLKTLQY